MPKRKLQTAQEVVDEPVMVVGEPRLLRSATKKQEPSFHDPEGASNQKNKPTSSKKAKKDETESQTMKPFQSKCQCGYDPHKRQDIYDVIQKGCAATRAFLNHVTFPSLKMIREMSGKQLRHHWVFFVEIVKVDEQNLSCTGNSIFGEEVTVKFTSNKKPTTFLWSEMKTGHVLAIFYAQASKIEVEVSELDNCYIFPAFFKNLINEGYAVLEDADLKHRKWIPICRQCGDYIESREFDFEKKTIIPCKQCKTAHYCSKKCEDEYINLNRHLLCAQSHTLLNLASLPRQEFRGVLFSFKPSQQPKYIYKEEYLQLPWVIPDDIAKNKCGMCGRNTRECFIDKQTTLTQIECCNNWICFDEDSYHMRLFGKPFRYETSCYRDHYRYSLCFFHFNEKHKAKSYKTCTQCKKEFPEDYEYYSMYNMKTPRTKPNKSKAKK
jgi:hypothetical protein